MLAMYRLAGPGKVDPRGLQIEVGKQVNPPVRGSHDISGQPQTGTSRAERSEHNPQNFFSPPTSVSQKVAKNSLKKGWEGPTAANMA